eukprot:3941928-Rhodomonas_salina.2
MVPETRNGTEVRNRAPESRKESLRSPSLRKAPNSTGPRWVDIRFGRKKAVPVQLQGCQYHSLRDMRYWHRLCCYRSLCDEQ